MNLEKRYCKNRIPKRKKKIETLLPEHISLSTEDERQFKLTRFIQDLSQFENEEENVISETKKHNLEVVSAVKKSVKRVKPAQQVAKRGIFQNGAQTKFYTRAFGKEVSARLDEDLQQIISLVKKPRNEQPPTRQQANKRIAVTKILQLSPLLPSRSSNDSGIYQPTFNMHSDWDALKKVPSKKHSSLNELEKKLYLEFTRITTQSCIESSSIQIKNQSYDTALRRKLLEIHQQRKENSEEIICSSHKQIRSTSTPLLESPYHKQIRSASTPPLTSPSLFSMHDEVSNNWHLKHNTLSTYSAQDKEFNRIDFKPEPIKSTTQFLKETVGSRSSNTPKELPYQMLRQASEEPTRQRISLRTDNWCSQIINPINEVMRGVKYIDRLPIHPLILPASSVMIPCEGRSHSHLFKQLNKSLLPQEEESPEIQYIPRRMF